jgi:hypothetical protein
MPWELLAWIGPLALVTAWILGYTHFPRRLRRKHPDLFEEWRRRTAPAEHGERR